MKTEPRRSMSVALQTVDLPQEAIALIKAGTPQPLSLAPALEVPAKTTFTTNINAPSVKREAEQGPSQEQRGSPVQPVQPAQPGADSSANEIRVTPHFGDRQSDGSKSVSAAAFASFVSITVRVPAGLPIRLLRAATDRKINQQSPFTQQDIVAQALEHWLETHGY